jgi:hypothetical protein
LALINRGESGLEWHIFTPAITKRGPLSNSLLSN